MLDDSFSRRHFLSAAAGVTLAPALLRADLVTEPVKRLKKAVKFQMIEEGETVEQKLALIREVGFDGFEIFGPAGWAAGDGTASPDPTADAAPALDIDRDEVVAAIEKTGVVCHGVLVHGQWSIRHSDPDPAVREQALERLKQCLRDCAHYGGTTVLVVPGGVDPEGDGDFDTVWERSTENIRKAIPTAEATGCILTPEVVWNDFLTTPEQFIEYVDQFDSPYVQGYFDVSNMIRYGVPPAEWIRRLGPRMAKFDFKGYSLNEGWVGIGEGDEDWPEVRRALEEIGYRGWATAEVSGGGRQRLREVSHLTNKHVLGL